MTCCNCFSTSSVVENMTCSSAYTLARRQRWTYILGGLIMDLQRTLVLIQYTIKHLIEDHLTQFILDDLHILSDFLGDPAEFDRRVWLDDSDQILLEERIVENGEVSSDEGVLLQFWTMSVALI
jgi:hypothetical protein